MSHSYQASAPLTQKLLFGYTTASLPQKVKRRKYQTFILAPDFEGLMKKYPPSRRGKSSESASKQLELSFHEK